MLALFNLIIHESSGDQGSESSNTVLKDSILNLSESNKSLRRRNHNDFTSYLMVLLIFMVFVFIFVYIVKRSNDYH